MADLDRVRELATGDHNLAVVSIARPDGSVQTSVVTAGVIVDPVDSSIGVGFVANGGSAKLRLLRRNGQATVTFKSGFRWTSVGGPVRLIGPDDPDPEGLGVPDLIRTVHRSAGGDHEDWAEFDRVMADDRRCAVFIKAEKISSNPGSG